MLWYEALARLVAAHNVLDICGAKAPAAGHDTPFSPPPEPDYSTLPLLRALPNSVERMQDHFRRDTATRPKTKRNRVPAIPEPTYSDPWNPSPTREDADARRTVWLLRAVLVHPDLLEDVGT